MTSNTGNQAQRGVKQLSERDKRAEGLTDSEGKLKQRFDETRASILQQIEFIQSHELAALLQSDFDALQAQLTELERDKRLLVVEADGIRQYPRFQFAEDGVISLLAEWLPSLLKNRNPWFVLNWLLTETTVLMERATANQDQVDKALQDFDSYQELCAQEEKQSVILTARPLDLAIQGREVEFAYFCQDHLNPDGRVIPTKELKIS